MESKNSIAALSPAAALHDALLNNASSEPSFHSSTIKLSLPTIDLSYLHTHATSHPYTAAAVTLLLLFLTYIVTISIHRLYFDPLSRFPGPKLAACTDFWYSKVALRGDIPFALEQAHAKYGPIVRIAPHQLSFSSLRAMDAIYSTSAHGPNFLKSHMYDGLAMSSMIPGMRSMLTQKDPKKHAETRKFFAPCFSTKALAEQEPAVQKLVDTLVEKVRRIGTSKQGMEMGQWFHAFSFDVTGELSFGESFGSVAAEKCHFWVAHILNHFKAAVVFHVLNKYPNLMALLKLAVPKRIKNATQRNRDYAETQVRKRLARPTSDHKKDFFSALLEISGAAGLELSEAELVGHAASFVIAGSETTGTALSSALYWLSTHPAAAARLRQELHANFTSTSQITAPSTCELPFLNAVIKESMRLYLPVPWGGTRISPHATTIDGVTIPAGTEVSSAFFANARSEEYFHQSKKFLPERWLPGGAGRDKARAFQPFSLGPRNCVGRYMAMMEMRLVISRLVWEFNMELRDGELDLLGGSKNYLMWEKPEVWIRFTSLVEKS